MGVGLPLTDNVAVLVACNDSDSGQQNKVVVDYKTLSEQCIHQVAAIFLACGTQQSKLAFVAELQQWLASSAHTTDPTGSLSTVQ